jgi:DNA-binding NarL/FixJ family response regulator
MARQQHKRGPKLRLFVVDDEPAVCKGLKALFSLEPGLEVCGEAAGAHEALKRIVALIPDVAIVDLTLKEGDGLGLIRQLHQRCPALKVLVFSMHDQVHFAASAFAAGAQGYVLKEEGTERVIEAIQVIMDGGYYLSQQLATKAPDLATSSGHHRRVRPS